MLLFTLINALLKKNWFTSFLVVDVFPLIKIFKCLIAKLKKKVYGYCQGVPQLIHHFNFSGFFTQFDKN